MALLAITAVLLAYAAATTTGTPATEAKKRTKPPSLSELLETYKAGLPPANITASPTAGYSGDSAAAAALHRANRVKLAGLMELVLERGGQRSVCDATAVPMPAHQHRPMRYAHVPKCGSTFSTTVMRYACPGFDALPDYGQPTGWCDADGTKRSGAPKKARCTWEPLRLADLVFHSSAALADAAENVTAAALARTAAALRETDHRHRHRHLFGERRTENGTAETAAAPDPGPDHRSRRLQGGSKAGYPVRRCQECYLHPFSGTLYRQMVHQPLAPHETLLGAHVASMFRLPDQRLISAYHFHMHAWGMPQLWHSKLQNDAKTSAAVYARFPGVRGCAAKMIGGNTYCGAFLDLRSTIKSLGDTPGSATRPPPKELDGLCYTNTETGPFAKSELCAAPWEEIATYAAAEVSQMAFVGLQELWAASTCLFHRLHGGPVHGAELPDQHRGDSHPETAFQYPYTAEDGSEKVMPGSDRAGFYDPAVLDGFVDWADEMVYAAALERFETDLACVLGALEHGGDTTQCADLSAGARARGRARLDATEVGRAWLGTHGLASAMNARSMTIERAKPEGDTRMCGTGAKFDDFLTEHAQAA